MPEGPGRLVLALRVLLQRLRVGGAMARHPGVLLAMRRLHAGPPWDAVAARHPRVLRKVFEPCPVQGLTVPERLAWLREHQAIAQALFSDTVLRDILLTDTATPCRVALPEGAGLLTVRLLHAHHFEHEGELTLQLHDPSGTPLYALSFLFTREGDGIGLVVGGLQGRISPDNARHITRLALGMRPPALLLFVLQALAGALGVQRLRAVGAARHVYAGRGLARRIRFDYDAFWASAGGEQQADGLWQLPRVPPERTPAEMPPHKRALYRRRYAWLATLRADVQAWVAAARRAAG